MADKPTQVIVRLPVSMLREIDRVSRGMGCISRSEYFRFLHWAFRDAVSLPEIQQRLLLFVSGVYGGLARGPTPDAARLASEAGYTEAAEVKKALLALERMDFLVAVPLADGSFSNDVTVDGRRLQLTTKGKVAAEEARRRRAP